jgi:hypothetical protein
MATSKTVRSPANPVERKPPTTEGDDSAKRKAMASPKPQGHCFVDFDHSALTSVEQELYPTEVQLPNSSVKARVLVCLHHKMEMEALQADKMEAARTMSIAPYGRCFVCDDPVGLRDESTPLPSKPGDTVPVNFWERMDKLEHVVHLHCRRGYKELVVDDDGNESKPGWHKKIALV